MECGSATVPGFRSFAAGNSNQPLAPSKVRRFSSSRQRLTGSGKLAAKSLTPYGTVICAGYCTVAVTDWLGDCDSNWHVLLPPLRNAAEPM
jgi:hypothetical protein